jgi:hypothetical protein
MANQAINAAVSQLKQEHIRLCKELARVDEALSVLGSLEAVQGGAPRTGKKIAAVKPKRKISAAARKKMSDAARARWAAKKKTPAK